MSKIYINGKFLTQRLTGVQRQAFGLLKGFDFLLSQIKTDDAIILLCPRGVNPPELNNIRCINVGFRFFGYGLWEQVILPMFVRRNFLLNLTGSAPLFKSKQFCVIADAAIYDHPEAYGLKYKMWYKLLYFVLSNRRNVLFGTVSNFSFERVTKYLKLDSSRVQILDCSADHMLNINTDTAILEDLGLESKRYFLAVGSLNPTKNIKNLVDAYASTDLKIPLVIVGGFNSKVFGFGSNEMVCPENIIFAGPIDDISLKTLYKNAYYYIFPSIYEGFGIPPLEAMYCGCPVMASNAASIPEVCGDAALYFDPFSVDDIRGKISQVLNDLNLRDFLIGQGFVNIKRFNWNNTSSNLYKFLKTKKILA